MNNESADINKYYSPEDIAGYEAFVGPKGEYYKVKKSNERGGTVTHYSWAEEYVNRNGMQNYKENENITSKCKTPLEFLINYLGFVRYTHSHASSRKVYLTLPNPILFGKKISKEQIDSLYKLMNYNNDDITYDLMQLLERHESKDYFLTDKVFEQIKNSGGK